MKLRRKRKMDKRIMPPFKLAENGCVENTDGQICDLEGRIVIRPMMHTYYPPAYPENKTLVKEFSNFIVTALNEKFERDFGEGEQEYVSIDKTIAEKLLKEINTHINNSCDDPRMGGRAPAYLYELQSALQTALSAEGK
jgi:hypothetical protein